MEEATRLVPEAAGAPGTARAIALASLDEIPSVVTAPEWRALEGRLEWSPGRKAFVLREADDVVFRGPEPASREAPGPEEAAAAAHRPTTLSGVVGQPRVVESLSVAVGAARLRGDALGHVLLTGQPGLGKTTLSGVLAREMGGRLCDGEESEAWGGLLPVAPA